MDDYIDRQAAIDTLAEQIALCDKALKSFGISMKDEYAVKVERASLIAYKEQLEAIHAADVVPVVHGKWIHYRCDMYECSACERIHTSFDNEKCDANFAPTVGQRWMERRMKHEFQSGSDCLSRICTCRICGRILHGRRIYPPCFHEA